MGFTIAVELASLTEKNQKTGEMDCKISEFHETLV